MWLASLLACDPAGTADERLAQGLPEQAVEGYAQARSLTDPQRQRYARALVQTERYDAAAKQLDQVEELDATGLMVRGTLASRAGEPDEALRLYEAGYALSPMPELAHNICTMRLALDQDAVAACMTNVEANPESALAYAALGQATARSGATHAALEALSKATHHVDQEPEAADWIAQGWMATGEHQAACDLVEHGRSVAIGLGCLYAGDLARAEVVLEPLAEDDSAAAGMLRLRVEQVEQLGESAAKAIAIEKANRWDRRLAESTNHSVLHDRARLALADGRPLDAEALWRQAVAVEPCAMGPWLELVKSARRRGQDASDPIAEALAACPSPLLAELLGQTAADP